jgi:hypothetical protein
MLKETEQSVVADDVSQAVQAAEFDDDVTKIQVASDDLLMWMQKHSALVEFQKDTASAVEVL